MHPYITFDVFWHGMSAWLTLIGVVVGVPFIAYLLVKAVASRMRDKHSR